MDSFRADYAGIGDGAVLHFWEKIRMKKYFALLFIVLLAFQVAACTKASETVDKLDPFSKNVDPDRAVYAPGSTVESKPQGLDHRSPLGERGRP